MRPWKLQFRLRESAVAVAVLACLFAGLGVSATLAILVVALVLVVPVFKAGLGKRMRAAATVLSVYPLLVVCAIYATWFFAWFALGHRPRTNLDDPKFINPIVMLSRDIAYLLMLGLLSALILCVVLVVYCIIRSVRSQGVHPGAAALQLLMPLLGWLAPVFISRWNLFDFDYVLGWFMD
jgi:hypothetical protein